MSEHTKTPWEVDRYDEQGFTIRTADVNNQRVICWNSQRCSLETEDEANAAFIVRAVNAHEALMNLREAVRLLLCALDSAQTYSARREVFSFGYGGLDNALSKANAALALAEKGE
mgnify:CR=1 FL=1